MSAAFRTAATACLAQNKPAGELVDCVTEHFPDVEVYRENDDLIIKGGSRFLVVRRDGPDVFRVTRMSPFRRPMRSMRAADAKPH
jgi:hypothetical protein